ncbi:site-specific integrase [Alphaproteobacteria bacterium]|nr:site-specific integrase [Alphaproteobacteria bacterium]
MANIRKRGDKWQVQVRRQGFPSRTQSFCRQEEAKAWGRAQELAMDRKEAGVYHPPTQTLASILSRYLAEITPTKKSYASETRRLNRLLRDPISKYRICELSPEVLAKFRDRRVLDGLRASGYDLQLIRHALNIAAAEWGLGLKQNPVNVIRMPPKPRSRERRLKPGEYELLVRHARQSNSWYMEPLIILAVDTGMRLGEMLKLKWEDWDVAEQTLLLRDTKNGSDRLIPVNKRVSALIKSLPLKAERIVPTNYESVKSAWVRLRFRTGLQGLRFHDLRHEAISRWFEQGLTIPEAAILSGHKTKISLLAYAHASQSRINLLKKNN